MEVLTIVGARPQFVKAAVVSRAFRKLGVNERILHTGQHFDAAMSDVFFDEMEIPKPHFNLDINGVGHGAMTGRMLEGIEQVMLEHKPKVVLVYGDTNSTLAGALAAQKLHIPVVHVEAGLRSYNMRMPEEVNRILTDRISSILYTPTITATKNLEKEGYAGFDIAIEQVGDVMEDAAQFYSKKLSEKESNLPEIPKDFVLVTAHRAENTDDEAKLTGIIQGLELINTTTPVIFPLHPRTKGKLKQFGITPTFQCIEPVGYFDMIRLLQSCSMVLTDSGGLQKEAYFFKKPCITMRDQTEWVELIQAKVNILVACSSDKIKAAFDLFSTKTFDFSKPLYGGGEAGDKIAKSVHHNFLKTES